MDETFLEQFAAQYRWQVAPAKRRFHYRKHLNNGMRETHRLALTMKGVIDRSLDDVEGLQASDYSTYQVFEEGDLAFKLIDLENIKTSRVGLVPRPGIMSPAYIRLVPRRPNADSRYYAWFFFAVYFNNIFNGMGGGVRQNLTPTDLLEFPIPLPDLSTQRQIADFLDRETARIDVLIEKKQRVMQLLTERNKIARRNVIKELQSEFSEWKLSHVCLIQRGRFNHRPRNAEELYGGRFPFLQTGDVAQANKFISDYKQTLSDLGASISKEFKSGTILMAIAANVGDVAMLEFNAFCPDSVVGFFPNSQVCRDFLYYFLKSSADDIATSSTSNAQDNTNIARLSSLRIPLPNLERQKTIADRFSTEEEREIHLNEKSKSSIERLREYRAALITAAVTGQINVAEWGKVGTNERQLDAIQAEMEH
jgi:type I restriction enzyme S subunit